MRERRVERGRAGAEPTSWSSTTADPALTPCSAGDITGRRAFTATVVVVTALAAALTSTPPVAAQEYGRRTVPDEPPASSMTEGVTSPPGAAAVATPSAEEPSAEEVSPRATEPATPPGTASPEASTTEPSGIVTEPPGVVPARAAAAEGPVPTTATTAGSTVLAGDWDGDGHDTPARFTAGTWALHRSADASDTPYRTLRYGAAGDVPVAGDWDGDGVDSPGVWRAGEWWLRDRPIQGGTWRRFPYGIVGDVPVVGDFDGDGRDEPGAYRPSTGIWYLRSDASGGGTWRQFAYGGEASDVPLTGTWQPAATRDGVAIYRAGRWWQRDSVFQTGTSRVVTWGQAGDAPVVLSWTATGTDTIAAVRGDVVWLHGQGPGPHYVLADEDGRVRSEPAIDGLVVHGDWDGDGNAGMARVVNGRWRFHQTVDGADPAAASARYGYPGDVPVAGDFDGDGRDSYAIYRRGTWYLRDEQHRTVRVFRWGVPGDRPVVGDFNGDGRDDVGVYRRGTWFLRDAPTAGGAWRRFDWGAPDDIPLAGRWRAGAANDGIGVYRRGTWILSLTATHGTTSHRFTHGSASTTPVTTDWRGRGAETAGVLDRGVASVLFTHTTPSSPHYADARYAIAGTMRRTPPPPGPAASPCPRADRPADATAAGHVVPSMRLDAAVPPAEATAALRRAYGNGLRHLLTTRYEAQYRRVGGQPYAPLWLSTSPEVEMRGPAMEALAIATALRTGAYDAAATTRSRGYAADHARWLVRSVACDHASNATSGWRSAHWAFLSGMAGWLLWDTLPERDRGYVAGMVAHEADRLLSYEPRYYRDRDGVVRYPGDTQSEQVAGNAMTVALAQAMMPTHPNARAWRAKSVHLFLASFAAHRDTTSTRVVNGRPLADWLAGSNVEDDYTVVNHNRIHPDYATVVHDNWLSALLSWLAGKPAPEAVFHNGPEVYGSFSTRVFPSPPYLPPGGTVYQPGAGRIYYPETPDWSPNRVICFASIDGMAAALRQDGLASRPAAYWEDLHLTELLAHQSRSTDGRAYLFPAEDRYLLRDPYVPQHLAVSWLAHYVVANGGVTLDRSAY